MKSVFILLLIVAFQGICNAAFAQNVPDTTRYSSDLTLAQAKAAEDYVLKNHVHTVVLWCACCTDEQPEIMSLKKLYHRQSTASEGYELFMVSETQGADEMFVNISHLWVHEGKDAVNLGHKVKPEIDPCSPPIPWTFGR
jgi:hypothetical protein